MLEKDKLKKLLTDLESDRVERKSSLSQKDSIKKTICAFANDLPGNNLLGIIFIGAKDDGTCANVKITDDMIREIANIRSDGNILPPPVLTVKKEVIEKCELAVITVEPSIQPPVRYNGKIFVRVGSTTQEAKHQEEIRLIERQRNYNLPFDYREVRDSTKEDLNMELIDKGYIPFAISSEILAKNKRNKEEQYKSLRFLSKNGVPTYGSIILFGKSPLDWVPGSYVQFLRIEGERLTDPIKNEKKIEGPLFEILRILDELIKINISTNIDVSSADKENKIPDYPVVAIQQLIRNALLHRSYENTNAPVKFYWFSGRIEISNPGGLFGQVNETNFGKGVTDYRNPLIAEAMRILGYIQRFGMGIPLAKEELNRNGNPPPEFQFGSSYVLSIIRGRK